ncbi:nucleoside-diphosphate kinase [Sphingomonas piscis]|uniref:Nucleoside-diphosphate kinase n=1 Tax=Sphingomonas piscis TaxID=2714943 RepID=A0A6G7YRL8_9SPHN|nr:GreA/GreB family elongation factor [Sphingomonas piscis]QIK79379.1 nucleoside-diphosphate kinase [Sphingomonas piscis]
MSVAFRRESDDEHLEPKFELPIPPGPNIVTPRGYSLLEQRTAEVEAQLAATSDEEQRKKVQRDLRYWRARLASAQIAPAPAGDTVAIGTRVTIDQSGKQRTLTIVGHDEADPAAGLISFASPLGRALMGAEEGDEVDVPGIAQTATVERISAS